jgi:hypothetical protein
LKPHASTACHLRPAGQSSPDSGADACMGRRRFIIGESEMSAGQAAT